jgi:hypothetical protein
LETQAIATALGSELAEEVKTNADRSIKEFTDNSETLKAYATKEIAYKEEVERNIAQRYRKN